MYFNLNFLYKIDENKLKSFLDKMIRKIADMFEIKENIEQIYTVIYKECLQYEKTINHGQKLLEELFEKYAKKKNLAGEDVFKLYDTFGFPLELTREIAEEK